MLPSRLNVLIVDDSKNDAGAIAAGVDVDAAERTKLVLAATSIGIWEWNLKTSRVYWSPECLEIVGVKEFDGTLATAQSFTHPEDAESLRASISTAIETQSRFMVEFRIVRADAEIRWILNIGRCEYDVDGTPRRMLGTVQDITDRKLAERTIAESEARYRLALDATEQGTWRYDFATDTIWLDETCRIHHGLDRSHVKPDEIFAIVRPEDVARLVSVATAAQDPVDGDGSFSSEYRIDRFDGTVRWIAVHARYRFTDHPGQPVAQQINGITRDITRQKRAECAAYRQSLVLERIAVGAPLNSVLQEIVDLVEEQVAGSRCSIHLVDRERLRLRFAAGQNLPASFIQACDSVPIGPHAGSCGTAAFLGKPVIVADIAKDPLWEGHRELPLSHGLRSCWSFPILAGSRADSQTGADVVLGTFALYQSESSVPGAETESVLATAVHLARVVIERENSLLAIRESEARYAAISEITRSVTFGMRIKPGGSAVVEWVRPRFGLLSGYSEKEFGDQGWEMLFHPDDRNRVRHLFREIAAGRVQREELRYMTKAGETLTVLLQGQLLESGPGPGEGLIIGGLLDITELKAVEVALRASEERFQLALRGANEGLWDWDVKTNQLFLSPRWKSELGYEDDEIVNHYDTWVDLMHPEDRAMAQSRLGDFLNGPSDNYVNEFRMRHKSGEYRIILSRGFMIRDEQGSPARMVGTHQNITERKRADEELRASRQRLEVLSRQLITTREAELRHLARELHDEIGQVLTAMKMNLRSIQRSVDATLHGRLEENVSMIDHAVEQVRNLSLNMRPPHLDDLGLVATLHWYLKNQSEIAGFEEHLTVVPSEIRIPSDLATVCFRITQEAVTNSVRHAAARRVEIELRQLEEQLHLTIRDNGVGFDVGYARDRASEGTSLGLISMQERASLAGGRIEIVSAPGQGTTVHAWFPLSCR